DYYFYYKSKLSNKYRTVTVELNSNLTKIINCNSSYAGYVRFNYPLANNRINYITFNINTKSIYLIGVCSNNLLISHFSNLNSYIENLNLLKTKEEKNKPIYGMGKYFFY